MIYHNAFIDNDVQASDSNPTDNDCHHPGLLEATTGPTILAGTMAVGRAST